MATQTNNALETAGFGAERHLLAGLLHEQQKALLSGGTAAALGQPAAVGVKRCLNRHWVTEPTVPGIRLPMYGVFTPLEN
jgi:hypothetical protein